LNLIQSSRGRRKVIKIRAEINEIENRKSVEKISKTKNWFFEKSSKIRKSLARLTEKEAMHY
jgi:hypothetical protein